MSSQDLGTIFDKNNLKAISRKSDFVFKNVYELRVRKVEGDTTTFFVTLQFMPKKIQSYADFQAERQVISHPSPYGTDVVGDYFNYLSKYFKSRDFISSFQTDMINYVNKLFGQKGGFGIYPIQDYDIMETEPFTVVEMAFKGHFTRQSKRVGSTMSLRNKVIRLAHSNPELREHLLPLLKKQADLKLSAKDKKVLKDFVSGKEGSSQKLTAKKKGKDFILDGNWSGGSNLAVRKGDTFDYTVAMRRTSTKSEDVIKRFLKKETPSKLWKGETWKG